MMKTYTEIATPHGLTQIVAEFGDIQKYLITGREGGRMLRPEFEARYIVSAPLPFSIPLAWNPQIKAVKIRCHRRLAGRFAVLFRNLEESGLADRIKSYGGCFQFRTKRHSPDISTHSWGIAIDLNCATNAPGTSGDMDAAVVEVFESAGFIWGGRWSGKRKDPMHFQYCRGY